MRICEKLFGNSNFMDEFYRNTKNQEGGMAMEASGVANNNFKSDTDM